MMPGSHKHDLGHISVIRSESIGEYSSKSIHKNGKRLNQNPQ
jgi:hypothetical protein